MLAARVSVQGAAGDEVVLAISQSEVGKQLDNKMQRRMSFEGNLSAVSMAHVTGVAHKLKVASFADQGVNSEQLSIWVGGMPAALCTAPQIMELFRAHECEPLFCTPRVKAPPKSSWAVVAFPSPQAAAVAVTANVQVKNTAGKMVPLVLKEYTPTEELAVKERRGSIAVGALDSISMAHALNLEGMLGKNASDTHMGTGTIVQVHNIPSSCADDQAVGQLFKTAGYKTVRVEMRFAPGRHRSSALVTFSDTRTATRALKAAWVVDDEAGNLVALKLRPVEVGSNLVVRQPPSELCSINPRLPIQIIAEQPEQPSLEEWLGLKLFPLLCDELVSLGVDEVEDLLDLDDEDVVQLKGKLKKVQATQFDKKLVALAESPPPAPEPALEPPPSQTSSSGSSRSTVTLSFNLQDTCQIGRSGKSWCCFLSHYKEEAAAVARMVKTELSDKLPHGNVYLDSDDLRDLRKLLDAVKDSDVLVLMQTRHLLSRPWVLLEIYTAITNAVPIVTLRVAGPASYSFADAQYFLDNFETELERRNPGIVGLGPL